MVGCSSPAVPLLRLGLVETISLLAPPVAAVVTEARLNRSWLVVGRGCCRAVGAPPVHSTFLNPGLAACFVCDHVHVRAQLTDAVKLNMLTCKAEHLHEPHPLLLVAFDHYQVNHNSEYKYLYLHLFIFNGTCTCHIFTFRGEKTHLLSIYSEILSTMSNNILLFYLWISNPCWSRVLKTELGSLIIFCLEQDKRRTKRGFWSLHLNWEIQIPEAAF